jgi:hypothetical protein
MDLAIPLPSETVSEAKLTLATGGPSIGLIANMKLVEENLLKNRQPSSWVNFGWWVAGSGFLTTDMLIVAIIQT